MAYNAQQHSQFVRTLYTKVDSMDNRDDNPLYHILGPILQMNEGTLDMTSDLENLNLMLSDEKSKGILLSMQRFNTEIMDILEGRNNTASKPEIARHSKEEEAMSLSNLVSLLAEEQQFNQQLLIDSLDREGITRSNFSAQSHRKA